MRRATNGIVSLGGGDTELALARRLSQNLRDLILAGIWMHGEKLPGTRLIAKDAGVSRWTAVMAIDLLAAEGLVESRKRSGTYVNWTGGLVEQRAEPHVADEVPLNMPFALGATALDVFPLNIWRRIQTKSWQNIPLDALQVGSGAGWPDLRAAIATHLASTRGIKCAPAQIIVMPSAHAGILLAGELLCPAGSTAWTEDPCYPGVRPALTAAGVAPIAVAVDREGINVADGKRQAPRAAMAVVSGSRQFPTGTQLSAARKRALLDWSRETGAFIIEDDYGYEFRNERTNVAPMVAMDDAAHVLYMNTFSTTIFPSLRLAYLVVPVELAERFTAALQTSERYTTVPNQIVLADFIASGHFSKHLRRSRDAVAERRDVLRSALAEDCGAFLQTDPVDCGMHLFARFRYPTDDAAFASAAREAGLAVEPLSRFYAGEPRDAGLLLGFAGFRPEVLREASKRLARVLAARATQRELAWVG